MPDNKSNNGDVLHAILSDLFALLVPIGLAWVMRKMKVGIKPADSPVPFKVNEVAPDHFVT